MIYLTGDIHGRFERIGIFCDKMQTSRDDILIILGDAGISGVVSAVPLAVLSWIAKTAWKKIRGNIGGFLTVSSN